MKTKFLKRVVWLMIPLLTIFNTSAWGEGTESFENLSSATSYSSRSWTGDNGQSSWAATNARTDLKISGDRGLCFKASTASTITMKLTNAQKTAGIGVLSFKYNFPYGDTGKSRVLSITIGSDTYSSGTLSYGTSASYDGSITINSALTSNTVTINVNNGGARICVDDFSWTSNSAPSCSASPTVGNAANNGALVYSTSPMTIPVTCPSIGAGSSCEIKDYGFVWKAGGNPTIANNKTQIGTDNHSTAFSGNISGTFAAGTTYYVKAYAINNGDNTTLSTGTYSFTPRSITFNSNGGSSVATILVLSGTAASEPTAPTKDGYTFGGWYTDSGLGTAVNWSSNITSNKTYYAKWEALPTYTVSFETGTGNPTQADITETVAGAGITLPAGPTPACSGDGWSFAGWGYESCDDESTEPTLYIAGNKYYPASNETLYAVYVKGKTASTNYKLISDAAQIVSGENYVIAAYYNYNDYAITAEIQSSYYIKQTAVTVTENVISSPGAKIIWQLTNEGGSNVSLYNSNQGKYLYVYASDSYRNLGLYDSKKQFTMTEEREAGYASTFAFNSTDYTSYYINYDASHTDFGTKTSSDENLYLYKRQYTGTYESNPTCCTPHTIAKAGSPAGTVTGGTFSADLASACEGVEVTLNATPSSSAYKFGGWTITNGSSTDITTTVLGAGHAGDNPATMTMPNEAVTVNATFVSLSSIAVQTPPTKTAYLEGETFDPTGLVITRTYSNSTSDTYTYAGHTAEFTFSPTTATALTTSDAAVSITYGGQSVNQSINAYSVTVQAKDENDDAIAAGGPGSPTFTVATRGITPAADAANYKFWKWTISGAELGSAATTKTNTITNPTGNVTVTAVYYLPRTVTWLVNGEEWKPYTDAGSGTDGTAVVTKGVAWSTLTLPSDPAPPCGDKFVGWTIVDIGSAGQATDAGLDLMTSANKSDKTGAGHNVNDNITFHAVFADYVE